MGQVSMDYFASKCKKNAS